MSVRRSSWLLFLGEDPSQILQCPSIRIIFWYYIDYTEDYREETQITVDIMRSFVYFYLQA